MKLRIDDTKCAGHGRCYAIAPTLFEPDDYGNGRVIRETLAPGDLEAAELAVANCPEYATHLLADEPTLTEPDEQED